MPPYFYLSCAQADDGPAVQKFFLDLSDSIRVREKLPITEIVGCCGLAEHSRDEGLRTSRMMLAFVSSNYLRDHSAERDWQTFEQRKAATLENTATLARTITRINWSRNPGPLPKPVAETPVFPQESNGNGRYEPLAVMIGSIGKYKTQYAEFVQSLADYIVDSTASFQLAELDSIPDEVSSVFEEREEPEMKSQSTNALPGHPVYHNINQNVNQNLLVIDGTFVKTLTEKSKEVPGLSVEEPIQRVKENYLVFVSVKEEKSRERIGKVGQYEEFELETFENPDALFEEVKSRVDGYLSLPDLFVLELELAGTHVQGRELIKKLTQELKVRSAILVIYKGGGERSPHADEFGGAVGFLRSGFSTTQLREHMQRWARVGKNRLDPPAHDPSRKLRHVFLSYSSKDQNSADHICYQLAFEQVEVWYAAESLNPGVKVFEEVKAGLEQAKIFVALISRNYESSEFCNLELDHFYGKKRRDSDPFVIPVLYHCTTEELRDSKIRDCCREHQYIAISAERPELGYGDLFKAIKDRLKVLGLDRA